MRTLSLVLSLLVVLVLLCGGVLLWTSQPQPNGSKPAPVTSAQVQPTAPDAALDRSEQHADAQSSGDDEPAQPPQVIEDQEPVRRFDHLVSRNHVDASDPRALDQLRIAEASAAAGDWEIFSIAGAPERFDQAAYNRDPEPYLRRADARRIWQSAQAESGAEGLRAAGSSLIEVDPGGQVTLAVHCPAGSPATFVSKGLGAFANGLTFMTGAADDAGIARVAFSAIPGTRGEVPILVAAPLCRGQVSFSVWVRDAELGEPISTVTE
jgi:hypothetical protein